MKFTYLESVRIIDGFYEGATGVVIGTRIIRSGFWGEDENRRYTVKLDKTHDLFDKEISVDENDLEAL